MEYGHKSSQGGLRLGFVSGFPSSPRSSLVEFELNDSSLREKSVFLRFFLSLSLFFPAFLSIADDLSTLPSRNCRQTEHSRVNDFPMRRPLLPTYGKNRVNYLQKTSPDLLDPFYRVHRSSSLRRKYVETKGGL